MEFMRNKTLFLIIIIILIVNWSGCSVKKNYKVLTFFFDGVPDPEKERKTTHKQIPVKNGKNKAPREVIILKSKHPDFVSNQCNKCHDKSATNYLITDEKKLCFTCHKSTEFSGGFVHGPVAVNSCLFCHFPHESKNESLLKKATDHMCFECHKKEDQHSLSDKNKGNCTHCHNPHTGKNRFFLKNK
jgi:predicted CXXCH cytochrome family protein